MQTPAATIGTVAVLRDQALEPHQAGCAEQVRADFALLERCGEYAIPPTRQQPRQVGLPNAQGKPAQVFAIHSQHVEGVKLDLFVMLPSLQGVKVGHAVDAEHHGLAVDHELLGAVLQGALDNSRVSARPVVTVASEQPDAIAVADNDQAEAIMLDFVNPIRRRRHLWWHGSGWRAESAWREHRRQPRFCEGHKHSLAGDRGRGRA